MSLVRAAGIIPTADGYFFIISQASQTRSYYISVTDADSTTNTSFADTGIMWSGKHAPYSMEPYTPNIFEAFLSNNMQFETKVWAANNLSEWGSSTSTLIPINVSKFPPTTPSVNHIHFNGTEYDIEAMNNSNFNGTILIGVIVGTDPDGGSVTHNLSLYTNDRIFVTVINNTFLDTDINHGDIYADISFNTLPYCDLTQLYTLKVTAIDDEGNMSYSWLSANFTLFDSTYVPPISEAIFPSSEFSMANAFNKMMSTFILLSLLAFVIILKVILDVINNKKDGSDMITVIVFMTILSLAVMLYVKMYSVVSNL